MRLCQALRASKWPAQTQFSFKSQDKHFRVSVHAVKCYSPANPEGKTGRAKLQTRRCPLALPLFGAAGLSAGLPVKKLSFRGGTHGKPEESPSMHAIGMAWSEVQNKGSACPKDTSGQKISAQGPKCPNMGY